jgi:hypothetical protein
MRCPLSLRERARVRGTRRRQPKRPDEFASSTRPAPRANSLCCQKQISRRALCRTDASRQARWCFERCFPLTPALSLGEREDLAPRGGESNALRLAGVSASNRGPHGASGSDVRVKKDAARRFPLPWGRENLAPLGGESNALRRAGVSASNRGPNGASGSDVRLKKDAARRSPLPEGEGEPDLTNQNGRTHSVSSARPAPRAQPPRSNY